MNTTLLQQDLKALGLYTGAIDGKWGPKTEAAWTAFAKTKIFDGATFPYDDYKTVSVKLNETMRTEYLPALATFDFPDGMKHLVTVMAHAEGFRKGTRSYKTNNPGNLGNTDMGANKAFPTLHDGIRAQFNYILKVAAGEHSAYPMGKEKVIKPDWSKEIANNLVNYGVPTAQWAGFRFVFTGQLDQFIKIYATLPRLGNSYINTIVSYFAQHGLTIGPTSKIQDIIKM
jgi:hypothetical protein